MKTLIFLLLLSFSTLANSVCFHNGIAYQTGAIVGQYVCTVNGSWQRI